MHPHEGSDDRDRLLAENHELREMVAELHQLLEDGAAQNKQQWAQKQADYEGLLEEKSEIIRSLHLKVQELGERAALPPVPQEDELRAMSEDLERERSQLQQERRDLEELRRQLMQDEQTMTQQMREMEVQMARERADMARQRNELQRLQDDINREIERLVRDNGLNERLGQLRQRAQDIGARKGGPPAPAAPPAAEPKKDEPAPPKDNSLFRRLFG
jgi:hypothetical protein